MTLSTSEQRPFNSVTDDPDADADGGTITYTAEGVDIRQDTTQQFTTFVIGLKSGNTPISADRILVARMKLVEGNAWFFHGSPLGAMSYNATSSFYGSDEFVTYLFKMNNNNTGVEVWTKKDSDAGFTQQATVTSTRAGKNPSEIHFSCGYNGAGKTSKAIISDVALYTNPESDLVEGAITKSEAELKPEGWEAWVDWNFTADFKIPEADVAKASIEGISAEVPTDGSCYAVYTADGIRAYANTTVQFKDVHFVMKDGLDAVSADRIIKFRGRVNDGVTGKKSSLQVRADGSLGPYL